MSRYRYTLDDLYPMMNALKLRAESYNEWALNVNEALEAKISKKKSTWCRQRDVVMGEWGPIVRTPDPSLRCPGQASAAGLAERQWGGFEGSTRGGRLASDRSRDVGIVQDHVLNRSHR